MPESARAGHAGDRQSSRRNIPVRDAVRSRITGGTMPHMLLIEDATDREPGSDASLALDDDRSGAGSEARSLAGIAAWVLPDLISLQLVLPRHEGYRVLRTLREEGVEVPMAIVTSHDGDVDRVPSQAPGARGEAQLSSNLFDVVVRLEALLHRERASRSSDGLEQPAPERFGDVEVDFASRSVRRAGVPVPLTPLEFDLLCALLGRRGAVASRLELLRAVWGYSAGATSRTVDTHIANLRRKLEEDPSTPRHILTVWKVGYRLQP
jgi:two-component system alkaline phosphatase synthesis response regulator PhoP